MKTKLKSLAKTIRKLKPRRFRAYCVGAAKTGTTSIAECFARTCRSQHEAEVRKTNQLVIDYLENRLDDQKTKEAMIARDKRLCLELESSHPLGYLSGLLANVYPEAKFVVTIREPFEWLRSRINFHHRVNPPAWREYREYFWSGRQKSYAPEEASLREYGVCSLDVYLSQYADHYTRVLTSVPKHQRIVVRTSEIDTQLGEIAAFLGIAFKHPSTSRHNQFPDKIRPLDKIAPEFISQRIMQHCSDLLIDYFPERLGNYQNNEL